MLIFSSSLIGASPSPLTDPSPSLTKMPYLQDESMVELRPINHLTINCQVHLQPSFSQWQKENVYLLISPRRMTFPQGIHIRLLSNHTSHPSNVLHINSFTTIASIQISSLKALSVHLGENKEAREQKQEQNMEHFTNMLNPFHYFIHGSNNQWVKMENVSQNRA